MIRGRPEKQTEELMLPGQIVNRPMPVTLADYIRQVEEVEREEEGSKDV